MFSKLSAATLVAFLALSSASNSEPLGGEIQNFAKTFNASAKAIKSPVRAAKESCETELRTGCSFLISKTITIVAVSMEDQKTLGNLSIHIGGKPSEIPAYFQTIEVLMKTYAPDSSADERKVALGRLVQQIIDSPNPKVKLDGLEVDVLLIPGVDSVTQVGRGDIGLDSTAHPL